MYKGIPRDNGASVDEKVQKSISSYYLVFIHTLTMLFPEGLYESCLGCLGKTIAKQGKGRDWRTAWWFLADALKKMPSCLGGKADFHVCMEAASLNMRKICSARMAAAYYSQQGGAGEGNRSAIWVRLGVMNCLMKRKQGLQVKTNPCNVLCIRGGNLR